MCAKDKLTVILNAFTATGVHICEEPSIDTVSIGIDECGITNCGTVSPFSTEGR